MNLWLNLGVTGQQYHNIKHMEFCKKQSKEFATSIQHLQHDVVSVKISPGAVEGGFYPILKSAKFLIGYQGHLHHFSPYLV